MLPVIVQYQRSICLKGLALTTCVHYKHACKQSVPHAGLTKLATRMYASPARLNLPVKIAFKPPPPPISHLPSIEDEHKPGESQPADGPFDSYLDQVAHELSTRDSTSVTTLFSQYQKRAGLALDMVIPYEERPSHQRRADTPTTDAAGDGIVLVVHTTWKSNGKLDKICACSGFVVDAKSAKPDQTQQDDIVITCAHTLEQTHRIIRNNASEEPTTSFSFILTSDGQPRLISEILSSMPRSDLIAVKLESPSTNTTSTTKKLRSLPITPFPVHTGSPVLTHLFSASPSTPAPITRSQSRLPKSVQQLRDTELETIQTPIPWLSSRASRRWASGVMLGYRSYTGVEVEAGIHSSLPHILTSILPTPGSSGGPLVDAETGAVVGMISGRRMDNRVEGERGWGASAEGIFEMFSLPGFTPTGRRGQ